MNVGEYLKQQRGARSLTYLAKAVGVSVAYLSDVEKGRRGLSIARADQIAVALGLDEDAAHTLRLIAATSSGRVALELAPLPDHARTALGELAVSAPLLDPAAWEKIRRIAREA